MATEFVPKITLWYGSTRDSHIFAEGVEFRIRQKWILVCAFAGAALLFWMIYRRLIKTKVEKVKLI